MKFKVGDTVKITAGKDKGKQGTITAVLPKKTQVVVDEVNMYTRHIKPMYGQPGQKVRKPRPMPLSKVAIINDKGEIDRIGYELAKDGTKTRVFKKTGKPVPEPKVTKAEKK